MFNKKIRNIGSAICLAVALPYFAFNYFTLKEKPKYSETISFIPELQRKIKENSLEKKIKEIKIKPVTENSAEKNKNKSDNYIENVFAKVSNIPDHVTPEYIKAIIEVESSGNPFAVGKHGERGLMQLMSNTWNEFGEGNFYEKSFNSEENIEAGIKYILWINNYLRKNNPEWNEIDDKEKRNLITASYNAGPRRVIKNYYDIKQLPRTTRHHIEKVNKIYKRLSQFFNTKTKSIKDGKEA